MNERSTLINILLALINQSYSGDTSDNFLLSVDKAMELIRVPAMAGDGPDQGSLILNLKELADELRVQGIKLPIDLQYLKLRLKTLAVYHKAVKETLEEDIDAIPDKTKEECYKDYSYYSNQVSVFVRDKMFISIMYKWNMRMRDNPDMRTDRSKHLNAMLEELAPYMGNSTGASVTDINGIIGDVDVDDLDKLSQVYKEVQELSCNSGILKFDQQGWNTLFGKNNGMLRGTLGEIQAMSGGSKSETMRKMLTGIARVNEPLMIDPTKKPLIVYFTLEDTQREAFEKMFVQMYGEEHDCSVNIGEFEYTDIVKYVHESLRIKGYHFRVIEGEKHKVTPWDVISVLEALDRQGFEVHVMGLDYLLLLNLTDVPGFMDTYKIKNSYGIIGAYTKPRGIACITAAQIDDSAKYLLAESDEFAKDAVTKNLSAGSKYILHELDWRMFVHVQDGRDGFWYHQLAIGKNRTSRMTPVKDQYAVYRMHSVDGQAGGFIQSDYIGPNMVRTNTAGALKSEGGGVAF